MLPGLSMDVLDAARQMSGYPLKNFLNCEACCQSEGRNIVARSDLQRGEEPILIRIFSVYNVSRGVA